MDYYDWDFTFSMLKQGSAVSLYVGNIDRDVRDEDLYDFFSQTAYVVSIRRCRDPLTMCPFGYAYVFFTSLEDVERVLRFLNLISFNGKCIRVMYYGPNIIGVCNIFIKNLDKCIDHKELYETFCSFGFVLRFKVATDASGESKGFGFVQYDNETSAHTAIKHMNGMLLNDKKVYVGPFLQRDYYQGEREIVVKKIPKNMTEKELNNVFQEFGPTTSCEIKKDDQGRSKRFGYLSFANSNDAFKAVQALNGKKFGYYKEWFVAKPKSKDKYEMAFAMKRCLKYIAERSQSRTRLCVIVKKLDKRVTDEILKDFFSSYGTVTSCTVMRDSSGVSKGSGFVVFSKPEEASKAMAEINGETKIRKQVYMDHLVIALANATPEQQRTMLGESLYPMVEQLEPESAAKITGMLLEMEQIQVLHLLESLDALEFKVAEAMEILRTVNQKQQQHEESPTVSDHLKTAIKSADNIKTSLSPTAIDKKPRSSARVNNRKSARKRTAVLLTDSNDALESKATEAVGVVGTVNQQLQQDRDVLESQAKQHSKSFLSPNFRIPKPSSLARKTNRVSTRERSAVLLGNRFDSLRESENDEH